MTEGAPEVWSQTVQEPGGERLDRWLVAAMATRDAPPSRSQIQKWIEAGHVLVDGLAAPARQTLATGQRVEVRLPAASPMTLAPENIPLDIIYQDEHLAVINKPPGLTVHPSDTQREGTLVHALLYHLKDLSGVGGVQRPGIVHRIDKDTSGAIVITKTDRAHLGLAKVFAEHDIERAYWAYVYGAPTQAEGRIESWIDRHPTDRKRMSMDVKEGRRAVTHYRRVEEYALPKSRAFASWVEARLETGRTHQVRVHLTGLGHSLLGDPVYGTPGERNTKWQALPRDVREAVSALPGQALHARILGFKHPVTGEALRFEAKLPAALQALVNALESYR